MGANLLDVTSEFSRDELLNIPSEDRQKIIDGQDSQVSRDTLDYIRSVQTDLGAGEFIDVGGALAGAAAGAALGSTIAPGLGTVAGGVLGGALGTFGGEVVEDLLAGREIEAGMQKGGAAREAANSVLWDSVFLGGGKIVKSTANALGIDAGRLLGIVGTKEKPTELDAIVDFDDESVEGLRKINNYLIERNGGLTAVQTGQATPFQQFIESVANIGSFSGKRMGDRMKTNASIMEEALDDYIGDSALLGAENVGKTISLINDAGRKATRTQYTNVLEGLQRQAGNKSVSTSKIIDAIKSFKDEQLNKIESGLSKSALNKLQERAGVLESKSLILDLTGKPFGGAKQADLNSLIEFGKKVTKQTNKARPSLGNPKGDENLFRELTLVERRIKKAIGDTIADIDPEIARAYRLANVEYGRGMNKLRPATISRKVAQAASEEAYTNLGKIITHANNSEDVGKLLGSITTAFSQMAKVGQKASKKVIAQTDGLVTNAKQAKQLMRKAYLSELIKGDSSVLENAALVRLPERLKDPTKRDIAKQVLGDDFGQVNFMLSAIKNIAAEEAPNMMALSIRGKEIGSAGNVAGNVFAGGAAAGVGAASGSAAAGIFGVLAVFAIPEVLARITLNRNSSQRMLRLASDLDKNPNRSPELVASQVAKVIDALSDEDKNFISNLGL